MTVLTQRLLDGIAGWRRAARGPLVVALDGHGAAGKSTLAAELAAQITPAPALLHTDDFFRDPPDGADRHDIASYYDWALLRVRALEPLIAGHAAEFTRGPWVEPGPAGSPVRVEAASVIVLEGVSACAPALADLVDRRVLVETPEAERHRRIDLVWAAADWDHDWLAAEAAYLATQPPASFDLVVAGGG